MEPISGSRAAAGLRQANAETQKSGPSKFDNLRANLDEKLAGNLPLPPEVKAISAEQKKILENDLRRKLESGKSPQDVVNTQMEQLRAGLAGVGQQVAATPKTSAFDPLRQRLQSIEAQFNSSAQLVKNPGNLSDPKRLLDMQMQMYRLSQNVEILSRAVGDAASGVKTIVQTQV